MRKNLLTGMICILVCLGAYQWSGIELSAAKTTALEVLYTETKQLIFPSIYLYDTSGEELLVEDTQRLLVPTIVSFGNSASMLAQENIGQDSQSQLDDGETEKAQQEDGKSEVDSQSKEESEEKPKQETSEVQVDTEAAIIETEFYPATEKKVSVNLKKLQDFDYLRQNFYQVDNTTTITSELLNVDKFMEKDLTLKEDVEGPQILIYHTHSKESFADSKKGETVVALGTYLTEILENQYGIDVLHHEGKYDVPTRDNAYAQAQPNIEKILEENPSIEVVIDLHRDGVAETTHLVTEINGKPTAQIMFFNGLCRTTSGELGSYPNPYLEDNLACSFQMHLTAAEYYPGFARRIYLKGYRYNMHLCPKSMLIEVGAQTNTFQEAKNAMEPLADILAKVLTNE